MVGGVRHSKGRTALLSMPLKLLHRLTTSLYGVPVRSHASYLCHPYPPLPQRLFKRGRGFETEENSFSALNLFLQNAEGFVHARRVGAAGLGLVRAAAAGTLYGRGHVFNERWRGKARV